MSSTNELNNDTSIDDDAELHALEALLTTTEENNSAEPAETTGSANVPKTLTKTPCLQEDSTFAEAFSYEIDLPADKLQTAIKQAESVLEEEPDSSDDEEIKNFLERKYNEYGRDINKKLKQKNQEKHETQVAREVQQAETSSTAKNLENVNKLQIKNPHQPKVRQALLTGSFKTKSSSLDTSESSNVATPSPYITQTPIFTDSVFGLRIINPLISSTLLIERMANRKAVPVASIPLHIERGDLSKDWVFAGIVCSKSPVQTTKKDKPYSIWRLSDLRGEIKMISLFLFGGAHKELWKTAQGMCIAVLNPTVFEKRAQSNDIACLSIDTAQKVMVLGQSKDLGNCKARKRNNEICGATINLSECDYCIFHMKQEYGKMAKRSEFQSTSGGLNELRNKVLGKNEVFYGGQSYTAIPAKKSAKLTAKDHNRMSSLSEYAVSLLAASINHASKPKLFGKPVPYASSSNGPVSKLAANVEINAKQRIKDLERLRVLQAENTLKANEVKESPTNSSITTVSGLYSKDQSTSKVPEKFKNREFSFLSRAPKLSSENFCIEVNIGEKRAEYAKQKAAQVLKQRPLEKINPNSIRGTQSGKRRAIDELNEKFTSQEFKRRRLEEEEREKERKSRIDRIMAASSSHTNLVDYRELLEQDKYFSKLEKKEAMEEKMLQTYKMPCKAVICQKCKYTAFSAADRCKEEKHPLKIIDAEKRFLQCKDCGNRTVTVFKLPKTSCKNCQSSRWERTAMIKERKICNAGDGLSVRGDEETFLGSCAGNANLNLLVPDE